MRFLTRCFGRDCDRRSRRKEDVAQWVSDDILALPEEDVDKQRVTVYLHDAMDGHMTGTAAEMEEILDNLFNLPERQEWLGKEREGMDDDLTLKEKKDLQRARDREWLTAARVAWEDDRRRGKQYPYKRDGPRWRPSLYSVDEEGNEVKKYNEVIGHKLVPKCSTSGRDSTIRRLAANRRKILRHGLEGPSPPHSKDALHIPRRRGSRRVDFYAGGT